MIWRPRKYSIPFGKNEGTQERKELQNPHVVYWVCKNPKEVGRKPWVILLHSWGRNSGRMIKRASVYWDLGFSLIFIDARCHGESSFSWPSNGFTFGEDALRVAEAEGIAKPVVHGLSAGAIGAVFFAANKQTSALILEALVSNYRDMVYDTIRFFHLPVIPFKWVAEYLLSMNYPFEEYTPMRVLPKLDVPIFLLHGEKDRFFPPKNHFDRNVEALKGKENFRAWLVPNSKHSKMALHPEYSSRLKQFLIEVVSEEKEEGLPIETRVINRKKFID